MRIFSFCLALLFFSACAPSSFEDFQYEGEAMARQLVKELRKINHPEDLARSEAILKKRFQALVDLMIAAKEYQQKHPQEEEADPATYKHLHTETLREELKRVYRIEGGREAIERAQKEALIRLDGYLRSIQKEKR